MSPLQSLTELQHDALREVTNIAAARAASALSDMMGEPIMIGVPRLTVTDIERLPEVFGYGDARVVCVTMQVLGDLSGRLILLMPEAAAYAFSATMMRLGMSSAPSDRLDELTISCLMETGNVLGGAYSSALGNLTEEIVMLSTPTLGVYPPDRVFTREWLGLEGVENQVLCMETAFEGLDGTLRLTGHTVFVPLDGSLHAILGAIGMD